MGTLGKALDLNDILRKARQSKEGEAALLDTARNLGWDERGEMTGAFRWLEINALETNEDVVVEEYNFYVENMRSM